MKALRYLLILVAMLSVLSLGAQNIAQQPSCDFRSTSVMMGTGSALPQAAHTGAVLTGDNPGSYTTTDGPRNGHLRRDVGGGGSTADDEDPDGPGEPFPIGDAMWPLALCMMAYVCVRAFRKRRA